MAYKVPRDMAQFLVGEEVELKGYPFKIVGIKEPLDPGELPRITLELSLAAGLVPPDEDGNAA